MLKKKMPTNAAAASDAHHVVLERALADAEHRLQHDREHRGLEAEKQRDDHRHVAVGGIDVAQRHDGDDAGNDEQARRP